MNYFTQHAVAQQATAIVALILVQLKMLSMRVSLHALVFWGRNQIQGIIGEIRTASAELQELIQLDPALLMQQMNATKIGIVARVSKMRSLQHTKVTFLCLLLIIVLYCNAESSELGLVPVCAAHFGDTWVLVRVLPSRREKTPFVPGTSSILILDGSNAHYLTRSDIVYAFNDKSNGLYLLSFSGSIYHVTSIDDREITVYEQLNLHDVSTQNELGNAISAVVTISGFAVEFVNGIVVQGVSERPFAIVQLDRGVMRKRRSDVLDALGYSGTNSLPIETGGISLATDDVILSTATHVFRFGLANEAKDCVMFPVILRDGGAMVIARHIGLGLVDIEDQLYGVGMLMGQDDNYVVYCIDVESSLIRWTYRIEDIRDLNQVQGIYSVNGNVAVLLVRDQWTQEQALEVEVSGIELSQETGEVVDSWATFYAVKEQRIDLVRSD